MAASIGSSIPASLAALLAGGDLSHGDGITCLLLTDTADGWPHLAMISVGELVALSDRTLRAALWPNSTATGNLTRTGKCTLAVVYDAAGYYLRCAATRREDLQLTLSGTLAFFELQVVDVIRDIAPYADLTSGVTYRLKDPSAVHPRWREAVDALKSAAPTARTAS